MELLTVEDTEALFNFEHRNRAWFESWVPPRPEVYFDSEKFPEVLADLVRGMSKTTYLLFVRYQNGKIVGRFNFSSIEDEQAEIGYRVCQDYLGKGVASEGLAYLKVFASTELKLKRLVAQVASDNIASQKVLLRHSFVEQPTFQERVELNGQMITLNRFLVDL